MVALRRRLLAPHRSSAHTRRVAVFARKGRVGSVYTESLNTHIAYVPQTRVSWANALSDYTQSWEDYLKILVRIARRRNGESIEDDDVMEDVRLLRRLKGAKPPSRLVLQTHDVLEALDRGDETIDVVTLQPHSVDEDLYCELWDIQTGKVVQNPRRLQ
ncbi:hypothetical protein PENSPDRAFT_49296 [Peniophora sp. CONT]|nr:hypothetical protein PENSPDRAFT_49296 [Peniophora sp. CONT]